jgi:hypothetical protein
VDVNVRHEGLGKGHSEHIAVGERGHRDVVLDLFLRFASSCRARTISNSIQKCLSPGRRLVEDARTMTCLAESNICQDTVILEGTRNGLYQTRFLLPELHPAFKR